MIENPIKQKVCQSFEEWIKTQPKFTLGDALLEYKNIQRMKDAFQVGRDSQKKTIVYTVLFANQYHKVEVFGIFDDLNKMLDELDNFTYKSGIHEFKNFNILREDIIEKLESVWGRGRWHKNQQYLFISKGELNVAQIKDRSEVLGFEARGT